MNDGKRAAKIKRPSSIPRACICMKVVVHIKYIVTIIMKYDNVYIYISEEEEEE